MHKYQLLINRWTDQVSTASFARFQDMIDEAAERSDIHLPSFVHYLLQQVSDSQTQAIIRYHAQEAYGVQLSQ